MKNITNGIVTIQVAEHGAELSSLVLNSTGREYLWQADPMFWKRHSPVLFPIVGSVWDGEYRSAGPGAAADAEPKTYKLGQHGFARDMDFALLSETPDADGNPQLMFVLESNEETLKKYPYTFRLEIGYRLVGRAVEVIWRVINPDKENELKFQIGAHPAFYWPLLSNEDVAATVKSAQGYEFLKGVPKRMRAALVILPLTVSLALFKKVASLQWLISSAMSGFFFLNSNRALFNASLSKSSMVAPSAT